MLGLMAGSSAPSPVFPDTVHVFGGKAVDNLIVMPQSPVKLVGEVIQSIKDL